MPWMRTRRPHGFTLVEVLVALAILAMLSGMAWRAVNAMAETRLRTQEHTDALWTVDAALAQWNADLDALAELPFTSPLDWDGRTLRLTRHHASEPASGVVVVAWGRFERQGQAQWLRWQSPPLLTRAQWSQAWAQAQQWGQSPTAALRAQEVPLVALDDWKLYYFRGGSWSNPLSAAGATPGGNVAAPTSTALPDGIRLVLDVRAPHPLAGTLTRDWARPITLQGAAP